MTRFNLTKTKIDGLVIIEPTVFSDERGYFMETYNEKAFSEIGLFTSFVQDNQSKSKKGVIRGLHFQEKHHQGKLVRVLKGEVFDVAVDLRKKSPTYGEHVSVLLTEENKKLFYVPEGFAHGFLVLSEIAEFAYKTTDYYHPEYERGIIWNDPDLRILWPIEGLQVILSEKDTKFPRLKDIEMR